MLRCGKKGKAHLRTTRQIHHHLDTSISYHFRSIRSYLKDSQGLETASVAGLGCWQGLTDLMLANLSTVLGIEITGLPVRTQEENRLQSMLSWLRSLKVEGIW